MSTVAEILIVDDTLTDIRLLNHVLIEAGYTTRLAQSGETALQSISLRQPDLIVLDIKLPDMDGYTICRHLKLNQATFDLPVIFLSALYESSSKVQAFEAGGLDYVTKPYQPEEILARIHLHLTHQRLQKQLAEQNRQLQQQDATLNAIFAAVPDLLIRLGADGTYLDRFNRGNMLSLTDGKSCIGKNLREFLPSDLVNRRMYYIQRALETHETQVYEQEVEFDGNIQYEECRITKITDDDVLVMVRDVTDWERSKQDLQKARDVAEQANAAKSQFLANISHELRTPLNGILGFAQLLDDDPALTDDQRESLDAILHAGEHLLELINDLLEMSKIEAGKAALQTSRFNLSNLLKDLAFQFHLDLEKKGIVLYLDCAPSLPTQIETDERKLRQILINLLSNAIKFTDQGHITLRARAEYDRAQPPTVLKPDPSPDAQQNLLHATPVTLTLEVEDTGVGIAPEELPKLFQVFSQTQSGQTIGKGTGLGLAISRHFAEMLGGTIRATSAPGVGSTFQVQVQAIALEDAPPDAWVNQRILGLAPGHWVPRILVVENQDENSRVITKLLLQLGFQVQLAKNGEVAIALWQSWKPHLIFMDMHMPVMDGYEATRQIRQRAAQKDRLRAGATSGHADDAPNPVIIALTASAFKDQRERMKAAGCDEIICKPFRMTDLCRAIARHLGVRYRYASATAPTDQSDQHFTPSPPLSSERSPVAPPAPAPPDTLTPEALSAMSIAWLAELHHASLILNTAQCLELIDQIPLEQAPLAQTLNALVNDFRFDIISDLTDLTRH